MAVNGVPGATQIMPQPGGTHGHASTGSIAAPSSGTDTPVMNQSGPSGATSAPPLLSAVLQTLSQIGVNTSVFAAVSPAQAGAAPVPTHASTAAHSPSEALANFMHHLTRAVTGQIGRHDNAGGKSGDGHGAPQTPAQKIRRALQQLSQQLSDTHGTSGDGNQSELNSLQQSFQNLVGSLGGNGSATLTSFLQNLAGNLPSAASSATGNLLRTTA